LRVPELTIQTITRSGMGNGDLSQRATVRGENGLVLNAFILAGLLGWALFARNATRAARCGATPTR